MKTQLQYRDLKATNSLFPQSREPSTNVLCWLRVLLATHVPRLLVCKIQPTVPLLSQAFELLPLLLLGLQLQ